ETLSTRDRLRERFRYSVFLPGKPGGAAGGIADRSLCRVGDREPETAVEADPGRGGVRDLRLARDVLDRWRNPRARWLAGERRHLPSGDPRRPRSSLTRRPARFDHDYQ